MNSSTPPRPRLSKTLLLGSLLCLSCFHSAHAWWDSGWSNRKTITIDTTAAGAPITDTIGTLPVLVRLHDGNFNFSEAKDDGSDLRFLAGDDRTLLAYHIEKYDSLLNEALVWVKLPDVKPASVTTFYLYYGKKDAAGVSEAKATYDPNTVLVYHFADGTRPAEDSSGKGNTALNAGTSLAGALIGPGVRLDGQTTINLAASPTLALPAGGPVTLSLWLKLANPKTNAILYSAQDGANAIRLGIDNLIPYFEVTTNGVQQRIVSSAPLTVATWQKLAVVAQANKITLYLNGEASGSGAAQIPALSGAASLGGEPGSTGFSGDIDEFAIQKAALPAGLLKLASLEEGPALPEKLVTYSVDEQPSSLLNIFHFGYFGVILASVTIDGWIIILVLLAMTIISWYVMVTKYQVLAKVLHSNAEFVKEWNHMALDLEAFDHENEAMMKSFKGKVTAARKEILDHATLYRIYHIGVNEICLRGLQNKGRPGMVLSTQSIQAIKASLDAGIVRELQFLGSRMVLLTISISGGPFIGLLGTVVGVMITFAAIAATGDVNVNAIAPGISAALVATVAGLLVAIPALFGYNYLLAQIKNISSDMQVFADEFVTKMAELYRPR